MAGIIDKIKKTVEAGETDKQKASKAAADTSKKDGKTKAVFAQKAHKTLLGVIETEKSSLEGKLRKYYFKVSSRANKSEIKKAIRDYYGVSVTDVNIMRYRGKAKRFGLIRGTRSGYKKAIVTLKEGESISA